MTWKLTLPCTRAEAEAIQNDPTETAWLDPAPVLMTSEPDPTRPYEWRLDAYFEVEPEAEALKMLKALAPSSGAIEPSRRWKTCVSSDGGGVSAHGAPVCAA